MGLTTKPLMRSTHQSTQLIFVAKKSFKNFEALSKFAVWTGLEPATPCVTGRYSNQLNYQTKTVANIIILSYKAALIASSYVFFGATPTCLETSSPSLNKRTVGIFLTPYFAANS